MTRSIPIIPTILVVAAAGVMVWLGIWQLGRADEKAELIARYEAAGALEVSLTDLATGQTDHLFSRVTYPCNEVLEWRAIAGRNDRDQVGYAHVAICRGAFVTNPDSSRGEVNIGWSRSPNQPEWSGGEVTGVLAPGGELGWRVVADPPLAGLGANAKPDPNDLPNNHLAYAGQWFFFALTALVIYGFALKSRARKRD
ncbi:MAG: SURF1 family protein [Erythrobacter sp.]|nr:SURF1 family protein [Erythrobacter sp.]